MYVIVQLMVSDVEEFTQTFPVVEVVAASKKLWYVLADIATEATS